MPQKSFELVSLTFVTRAQVLISDLSEFSRLKGFIFPAD